LSSTILNSSKTVSMRCRF